MMLADENQDIWLQSALYSPDMVEDAVDYKADTLEELFEQGVKHPAVSAAITCQHIPANGSHCGAHKLSVEAAG